MGSKLELTWIGKDANLRLEPRILLEESKNSFHSTKEAPTGFENVLIHGDNLLALKALEHKYAQQVRCVFIDPPYNTGSAFEHYDDGLEHSLWLNLMKPRLEILRSLLTEDGSLWVSIDDNEGHYLKVLLDEVFGRECFVATVIWRSTDNSNNDAKQFSVDHNMILVYSRTPGWRTNRLAADEEKRKHFKNPDDDPRGPYFDGNPLSSPGYRANLCYNVTSPTGHEIPWPKNGWRWSKERMAEMIAAGEIRFTPDGKALRRRTYLADMGGLPPSTLWADLETTGHNRQAKYEQKNLFPDRTKSEWFDTPKPERLLKRVLEIATNPGDLVLDSFAGSGTTGAVAHKMGRRWIMIELGDHCETHILPRMRQVIDGTDDGGVSSLVDWSGGGGFRYYRLAPSLLERDEYDNWVISPQYNAAMLAEALCKFEGYTYDPSPTVYWQHGKSNENAFIYVTTQTLTADQLNHLNEEVGPKRSLLICCASYSAKSMDGFPRLTIKKIPKAVLHRCEWGRDDYSLAIKELPKAEPVEKPAAPAKSKPAAEKKKQRKNTVNLLNFGDD